MRSLQQRPVSTGFTQDGLKTRRSRFRSTDGSSSPSCCPAGPIPSQDPGTSVSPTRHLNVLRLWLYSCPECRSYQIFFLLIPTS